MDGASVVRVVSALVVGGEVVAGDGAAVVRVVGVVVSVLVVGGEVVAGDGAAVVRVVAVAVGSIVATSADSCSSETAATVSVPSP